MNLPCAANQSSLGGVLCFRREAVWLRGVTGCCGSVGGVVSPIDVSRVSALLVGRMARRTSPLAAGCRVVTSDVGMLPGSSAVTGGGGSMGEEGSVGGETEIESPLLADAMFNSDGAAAGNCASESERIAA